MKILEEFEVGKDVTQKFKYLGKFFKSPLNFVLQ